MPSSVLRCLLAAALVLSGGIANAQVSTTAAAPAIVQSAEPVPPAPVPPLQLVSATQLSPRLAELEFSTPYLEGPTRVRVLTPVGYDKAPGKRWPLLLLLHGTSETPPGTPDTGYLSWTERGDAEAITQPGEFLVVMPEARAGLYADHYGVAGTGGPAWQSYHLRQLLPWIDAHYRTIPNRAARAVAGLSMGGGGAMQYAARHPDLFSFAASYSGAVDPTDGEPLYGTRSTDINQALQTTDGSTWAFGPWATEEVRTRAHAAVDLVGNLRHTAVTLRTADGTNEQGVITDPAEFGCHSQTVKLHEALKRAGIAHTFEDAGPGGHTWDRFSDGLRRTIAPLNAHFKSGAGAVPTSFSHKWAAGREDIFGYHVASDRGFLEFASLDVAPGALTLTGSGVFTLTTPGQYPPGARYQLTATRGALVERTLVSADKHGRLSFAVDMGVRSTGQQYRITSQTRIGQVQIQLQRA